MKSSVSNQHPTPQRRRSVGRRGAQTMVAVGLLILVVSIFAIIILMGGSQLFGGTGGNTFMSVANYEVSPTSTDWLHSISIAYSGLPSDGRVTAINGTVVWGDGTIDIFSYDATTDTLAHAPGSAGNIADIIPVNTAVKQGSGNIVIYIKAPQNLEVAELSITIILELDDGSERQATVQYSP